MTAADHIFRAGYAACLDAAEQAGARILAGSLPTLRREHAAAGLLGFVDESRTALATDAAQERKEVAGQGTPVNIPGGNVLPTAADIGLSPKQVHDAREFRDAAMFAGSPKADRTVARAAGYSGDCCDMCGGMSMKRAGSCLTCEACGSTTGCS